MSFLPLLLSFPIFLTLMLMENILGKRAEKKLYNLKETLSNIYCGLGHLFFDMFFRVGIFALYSFFYSRSSFKIESNIYSIISLFVLIDFIYYWFHRLSHNTNLLWIIHRVHHQSEHYNYSVGLRQAWFHKLTAFWIYIPPAVLGFSAKDYIIVASIHACIQIWTHTNLYSLRDSKIKYLLVTPSHHHLHHATNKEYINTNYAGVFSVWDYAFGSQVDEDLKIITVYGVNDLDCTLDPVKSNINPLVELVNLFILEQDLRLRYILLFGTPGQYLKEKSRRSLRFQNINKQRVSSIRTLN